ncbi:MAG TPA: DUF3883 domain-containing protein [Variovorax sp.]|nr:DUF3883 domain-containing protein [Variovorax sp.]
MDKEVDPAVLAVINEKRLLGDKRTPVEIIARMGVFDARQQAAESAWLATGDNIIATVWAEFVSPGEGGRWFCLESLDTLRRLGDGGGERSEVQIRRAKDRLGLLKRAFDRDQGLRVVLQTNRVAIADVETDKAAKVSVRVPDDQEWHVAAWDADEKMAVLVRGERGWQPGEAEIDAARARGSVPAKRRDDPGAQASQDDVQAAAKAYLTKHFSGYGYRTEDVSAQRLGHDIQVSDKKGNTLLKLAVKGTVPGRTGFRLTAEERAAVAKGDPWRLAVVTEATSPAATHKLYKSTEIDNASGLEPLLD